MKADWPDNEDNATYHLADSAHENIKKTRVPKCTNHKISSFAVIGSDFSPSQNDNLSLTLSKREDFRQLGVSGAVSLKNKNV